MKESMVLNVVAVNDIDGFYTKGKKYSVSVDSRGSCEAVNDKGNKHWFFWGFFVNNFEGV